MDLTKLPPITDIPVTPEQEAEGRRIIEELEAIYGPQITKPVERTWKTLHEMDPMEKFDFQAELDCVRDKRDFSAFSKRFKVVRLYRPEIEEAANLLGTILSTGSLQGKDRQEWLEDRITDMMTNIPDRGPVRNKLFLGFYKGKRMIALLDIVIKYPSEEVATIGFLMVRKEYQRKGIGTEVLTQALHLLHSHGFPVVRTIAPRHRLECGDFWEKNGFVATGERRRFPPDGISFVMVHMES